LRKYSELRESRQSFGTNVLGILVVEVGATDGTVGFGVTTRGETGALTVEKHFVRASSREERSVNLQ
jgi:L-rhamnonate dehydratase